jgi:hypothetical protein
MGVGVTFGLVEVELANVGIDVYVGWNVMLGTI